MRFVDPCFCCCARHLSALLCTVVSSRAEDTKILPHLLAWEGVKKLGHGSTLSFRFPQPESGGDGRFISTSLLMFSLLPFPASSPNQRSTCEALRNQQPKVLWE